ncbi:Alkyl hydroperoxide reductase C [Buchnera aphidicola (Cinara kochiana kochiana)]|uniref:Thioredoxin peroxidase n=1 Tax=Buchnera aphidicola (Cinara kochiana kochiana) TaxID=2518976 RepID=A0A451D5F5_9GAMM|nr:redoxin domain-containing protein [Buchnera aphidicola]VFP81042.1 Alkyl hydroperoxide reductase C [Buchnera aphidicola (Cinara kochiana kochiana)]
MILVSKKAPDFTAPAILHDGKIINNFNLYKYSNKKITVLFFWPMDFTFVCPSELIAFNNSYNEFKNRDVNIIGVSIDSVYVHNAWRNTPPNEGGIGIVQFPMISDVTKTIQQSYGIEHEELKIALRASFIIDHNNIIRHQSINDLPIGRNIQDILRIIDALKFHIKFGEVCPANWNPGKETITATPNGIKKYLSKNFKKI